MKTLPLPKSSLLTKTWQYEEVYKHGTRVRGNGFSLIYLANRENNDRLGISISGTRFAVRRNRIKRILKEFYRHNRSFPSQVAQNRFPDRKIDMVIATKKKFYPRTLKELREILLPFTTR